MNTDDLVKVVNVPNTTDEKPPHGYDSWIDYWNQQYQEKQKQPFKIKGCVNKNCKNHATNDSEVQINGAHVKRVDNEEEYIIPLCNKCNNYNNKNEMDVYLKILVCCPKP